MTTSNKKIVISVIGFILSVLLICVYFYFRVGQNGEQYDEFLAAEAKIEPLFDALNLSVYESLPVPEGVHEIEQYSANRPGHGKRLEILYQFSTTLSIENIISFYDKFLSSNEWILDNKIGVHYYYHKGTACIDVNPITSNANKYWIYIYYDYFAQSFSISLEDFPALKNKYGQTPWQEFGETYYLKCPNPL
jgi:hypothetical protein